jgi:hypothetical protein
MVLFSEFNAAISAFSFWRSGVPNDGNSAFTAREFQARLSVDFPPPRLVR